MDSRQPLYEVSSVLVHSIVVAIAQAHEQADWTTERDLTVALMDAEHPRLQTARN